VTVGQEESVPSRKFSLEEERALQAAGEDIARNVEDNLAKVLPIIVSHDIRARQDEDGAEGGAEAAVEAFTAGPNVLPQVGQIIAAAFSNAFNYTRIVTRLNGTSTYLPAILRNRFDTLIRRWSGTTTTTLPIVLKTTLAPVTAEEAPKEMSKTKIIGPPLPIIVEAKRS